MTRQHIDVTPAVVATLAGAAGLLLTPERQQELISHLEAFAGEVARLDEVDVSKFEPPTPVAVPPRGEQARQ